MSITFFECPCAVVDHDKVDIRINQRLRAGEIGLARADGSADAQGTVIILAGRRVQLRFFDVFHRHKADAAVVVVHHQQLFDAVLVQQFLGFRFIDLVVTLIRFSEVISSLIGCFGFSAKRTSRLVRMPTSLPFAFVTGTPEMRKRFMRSSASAKGASGVDGDGVQHHARFIPLHAPHLFGLLGRFHVAVDDAHAACLRHRDRRFRLRHRVHGGRDEGGC